jgi:hypothetical protein
LELRVHARRSLLAYEDGVLRDELLSLLDTPKKLVPPDRYDGHEFRLLDAVTELALETDDPKRMSPKLDALIAAFGRQRRDEIYDHLTVAAKRRKTWARVVPKLEKREKLA